MRPSLPPSPPVVPARSARHMFTLLLALGVAACSQPAPPPAPPAPAPAPLAAMDPVPVAKACAKPDEKEAFDVTGLKTHLMIAALACGSVDKYNTFVLHNRPALVKQDAKLAAYFSRAFGRGKVGQDHLDSYKTDLANVQQQQRSRDAQFCATSDSLFGQAMAGSNSADIGVLATSTPIAQPVFVPSCN
jgi:hypothetical protein